MNIPFATYLDVEARWRELSDSERKRCDVLLDDASVAIATAMSKCGIDYEEIEDDTLRGRALLTVTCSMVIRAMKTPVDQQSATSYTQSANGYSESFSFSNPDGDLYMTKRERQMLGIGSMKFSAILPQIDRGCGYAPRRDGDGSQAGDNA